MNKLMVRQINIEGEKISVVDSREVAEMLGKGHAELLRDIDGRDNYVGIIPTLEKANLDLSNYFIPSTYKAGTREYKCYLVTKMGCELLGNKQQGEKGILFTAKYVEAFNKMEEHIKAKSKSRSDNSFKEKEIEAKYNNSLVRKANLLLKMIKDNPLITDEYKKVLMSKITEILTGQLIIPLPVVERKTYSATEIGQELGISANKVGSLANKHNLKTDEYGKLFHDKSKYSNKEVETFRYYDNVIPVLAEILSNGKVS